MVLHAASHDTSHGHELQVACDKWHTSTRSVDQPVAGQKEASVKSKRPFTELSWLSMSPNASETNLKRVDQKTQFHYDFSTISMSIMSIYQSPWNMIEEG